jgi:hypothetical protein
MLLLYFMKTCIYFGCSNILMRKTYFILSLVLLLCSCQKIFDLASPVSKDYVQYTIFSGQQYSDQHPYRNIETAEMKFSVRFDSSAIYKTVNPLNQFDINKLYGFSDNNEDHHLYSARIGWNWLNGALRLYAYAYNNGIRADKELGIINIGEEVTCSIKIVDKKYLFTMNERTESLPRESLTPQAKGYQLYPYFGGDEPAPHDIHIWIKSLPVN